MTFISIKEEDTIYHINISQITTIIYSKWLENNGNNKYFCTVYICGEGNISISKENYNKIISEINETNI